MADLEVKVNVRSLNTNTVLARDVTTDTGFILVTRNTMLSDKIIQKLIDMGVQSVYIKIVDYLTGKEKSKPIERSDYNTILRSNYNVFEKRHGEKASEVKESIRSIGNGGRINIDNLYNISDDIMGSLNLKMDVFAYLGFMEQTDDHTFKHSLNVSLLCNLFGCWMGLQYNELMSLTIAGMLHDIGKTKIPAEILNKPGKLTSEEFEIVKDHTILGYEMIRGHNIDEEIKKAVLFHHEKENGTGYPYGMTGDRIGDYAKIVAICDSYDAMTANRPYRTKLCPFSVINDFEVQRFGEFDTQYLLMFLSNIAYAYLSSNVLLSNNQRGEIVFINSSQLSRPIVLVDNDFIDLSVERDIYIAEVI